MEAEVLKAAVLGGGSFGTAIANILADNHHQVAWWMRNAEQVHGITTEHENSSYLPGYKLNPAIQPTTDLQAAVEDADVIFIAIPSKAFAEVVDQIAPQLKPEQMLVSTTKGIHPDGFLLMSQILEQHTCSQHIGVLSGPNLAKEIAARNLTGSVIASYSEPLRQRVQAALSCKYFRVYANSDRFGVELAGALKNIYAIAAGMAGGMNMGANTRSMLITRSLAEMSRFADHLGANPLTFLGLAGVGDLFVTCSSPLSRNYQVGMHLVQGESLDHIINNLGGTAEGINTVKTVKQKADELEVYMPLVQGLYQVIFEQQSVMTVIKNLMLGEHSSDVEFVLPMPRK